ncbi:hypothetical protein N7488_006151 [Penicillium malachiteum]|nr:hypothetical protein N7488_006151 [Penicillium malachiteum]
MSNPLASGQLLVFAGKSKATRLNVQLRGHCKLILFLDHGGMLLISIKVCSVVTIRCPWLHADPFWDFDIDNPQEPRLRQGESVASYRFVLLFNADLSLKGNTENGQ